MKYIISIILFTCIQLTAHAADKLNIVCTVPELADLVKQVGGDAVDVIYLVRPGNNPHFMSARPSFIRKIANADVFVVVGMDLEVGWAPALISSARNKKVRPGENGYIDCSKAISALEVPSGDIDRSAGDVHPHGNPHYLLSPICGIQVLGLLGERLAQIDPTRAKTYQKQTQAAQTALAQSLYGKEVVAAHKLEDLLAWHLAGSLEEKIGEAKLGGWMAEIAGIKGYSFIDDHAQWPYMAQCYGFKILAHLEPKSGVAPSSKHLQKVIEIAKQSQAKGIIAAPWFDPRHAQIVAKAAELPVLRLAHQAGALKGTEGYTQLCQHNVTELKKLISKP